MSDFIQATVTILSLVNPVICVAIFTQIEGDRVTQSSVRDATKASLAILVILFLSALFGTAGVDAHPAP